VFRTDILDDTGLADAADLFHQDQLRDGRINFPAPRHPLRRRHRHGQPDLRARESEGEELGAGLDPFLRMRSSTVIGILNGVDYDEWSPERDPRDPGALGAGDLAGKAVCKAALLERFGLPRAAGVPVLGIVSRLAGQKGFALLGEVAPDLLRRHGFQLVGARQRRAAVRAAVRRALRGISAPGRLSPRFSNELAHLIEAGSDMFVMPSRYEPCGLNQMYSLPLRLGAHRPSHRVGWPTPSSCGSGRPDRHRARVRALHARGPALGDRERAGAYRDPAAWRALVANGMAKNSRGTCRASCTSSCMDG